ncbi:hypothetical protein DO62_5146 [Burkholderia pseudomallei]|nr:hypothetical protein DO62_5146 [Burkholderia pseudomallei]
MDLKVVTLTDLMAAHVHHCWAKQVARVSKHLPDAVLVGGAIRDTYFIRNVKDQDYMTERGLSGVTCMEKALGRTMYPCITEARADYGSNGCLTAAYETVRKDVNLLLVTSILGRIQEFPDSISQIWYDGQNVKCTPAFIQTANTKVVTYNERMSPERLTRIRAKYPDFQFECQEG